MLTKKLGVTYIEIIITIGIIALMAALSYPFFSDYISGSNMAHSLDQSVSFFRKAQNYSMNNKDDETWGVCLDGNILRLYSNSCASPNFNNEYEIPISVSIQGLSDVQFLTNTGEPSTNVSVSIQSGTDSATIQVNERGGMTVL